MKPEDFTKLANDMVEDLMKYSGAILSDCAKEHGSNEAMRAFSSALAIACGNLISQLAYALPDPKQRSPFIRDFHTLIQETAEDHKKRTKEAQH